jgi:Flp pilus assembly protein TadD
MAKAQATSRARDVDAQLKLGDLLRRQSRYDGAVDAYTRALELLPQGSDRRWVVLYARGASAERTGAWDAAERDLQQALVLKPDTPTLLNFLGFAWAERGIQLQQARTMLQRASTMAPDDGAIADSLGWVMYRMGEFEPAVAELERAVALQPADGTINDHLGDAYWRVGRRREAQFQWERAAVQAEDPQLANRIRAKLAQGLAHLTPTPLLPGEGLGH